jgi:GR25 family glycosyltransferase involved in LPS biosynthesis
MKIFVLHYSKLTKRKAFMIEQFAKQNITDYEFIELYDTKSFTKPTVDLLNINLLKTFDSKVQLSSISLTLKHFHAYSIIADTYDSALILEDDAILCDNFMEKLHAYVAQLPETYDMLFTGDGMGLHIEEDKQTPGQFVYEKCLYPTPWGGQGASRCTDSYIISKQCATTLCKYIREGMPRKITTHIDFWINDAARDVDLKVYWAEPTLVSQGSQVGMFGRTLH